MQILKRLSRSSGSSLQPAWEEAVTFGSQWVMKRDAAIATHNHSSPTGDYKDEEKASQDVLLLAQKLLF